MKTNLRNLWSRLQTSYWFLPSLMTTGALLLAGAMIRVDRTFRLEAAREVGFIYSGGAEGARALLSTGAGSMITVAGVVFSITIVALTLASSQFGPRLLNAFMRDRGNQFVLGTFVATFLYCLLISRSVRGPEDGSFVPYLAVTVGVLLVVLSLGVLIYFIHHTAASIQAPNVIAAVGRDLARAIDRLSAEDGPPPGGDGRDAPAPGSGSRDGPGGGDSTRQEGEALPAGFEESAVDIPARETGYVHYIDHERLVELAAERGLVFDLLRRPGDFVYTGAAVARVHPAEGAADDVAEGVNEAFGVGDRPEGRPDVEFAVDQLVEIAVRALSPGINDPFTAMTCVAQLGGRLSTLAARGAGVEVRRDGEGTVRVVGNPVTLPALLDRAFGPIRHYARGDAAVALALLDALAVIGNGAERAEDRAAVRHQAEMVLRAAEDHLPEPYDRERVRRHRERIESVLAGPGKA